MISKSQIKFIRSLKMKKYRKEHQLFVVEGEKNVAELLNSRFEIAAIYALEDWINQQNLTVRQERLITPINTKALKGISNLNTPNQVVAIVKTPNTQLEEARLNTHFSIALDNVQDPGNLGTIIRTADWFGMPYIFCSPDCVEAFNPKVIQATMGSFARVQVIYQDLPTLFTQYKLPVYGALLNGQNIYQQDFSKKGFLLMGNESKGIRNELLPHVQHPITIPRIGGAESLNVAIATSICCAIMCS